MPRGVYNRDNMKKNSKNVEAPKKSSKPLDAEGKFKDFAGPEYNLIKGLTKALSPDAFSMLYQIRDNLVVLNSLGNTYGASIPSIVSEIETHIGLLSKFSKLAFSDAVGELDLGEYDLVKSTENASSIPSLPLD